MQWVPFAQEKYAQQELPRERRYVLVQIAGEDGMGMPPSVAVGYLRFGAGDPDSPYFVVPGFGRQFVVVAWSDCLGDGFYAPLWAGKQKS